MSTVIRHSVFETNSSSSHSISIAGGEYKPDRLLVEDGVCRVYPGEFGWEVEDYYDAATKASYCVTYIMNCTCDDQRDEEQEMLRRVIAQNTGADEVQFVKSCDEFWPWGYIDHQSDREEADGCGAAFANEKSLG